jgi:uncharacterized protein
VSISVWIGALAIGLSLGLLGSGGSILTVPVLVYLAGQDEKVAIAGSLFAVGSIALAGSLQHLGSGRIDWKSVLTFGVPGIAGTYAGAALSRWIPGIAQLVLFALVMFVAAWLMLRPPSLDAGARRQRAAWKAAVDGFGVGILTGLVGVGGGFLIVPALVLLGGLPMHAAVATSLVIIAMKSFGGFLKYLQVLDAQSLSLDWQVLGLVTAVGIAGSFIGKRLGTHVPQHTLRKVFAWFVVAMAVYIIARSAPGLLDWLRSF